MQVMTELWIFLEAPGDDPLPKISQHLKTVHSLWPVLGAALTYGYKYLEGRLKASLFSKTTVAGSHLRAYDLSNQGIFLNKFYNTSYEFFIHGTSLKSN